MTITDGEDNSTLIGDTEAQQYTSAKVKEMVKHQTEVYKWDFAYIGANQDAWAVGGSMGVANNLNYAATSAGTAYAFDNLTKSTLSYRSAGPARAFAFTPDADDQSAPVKVTVDVNPVVKKKTKTA